MLPCAQTAAPSRARRPVGPAAASVLLLLVWLGCLAGMAWSAEDAAGVASDSEARAAIRTFAKAARAKDPVERAEAVRTLGRCLHGKVTDRLLKFVRREPPGVALVAAYEVLARHRPFAEKVVPRLARRLGEEAEAAEERLAKGDGGFRVDPRTGDADTASEEGRAHLEEDRIRAASIVALLAALEAHGWAPERDRPDLSPFLQSASDELVVVTLRKLAAWKAWAALPAVLTLYRMYPTERSWETGEVVDLGGTNATAKRTWMTRFGHPDKQRPRPAVVQELQRTIHAVTGMAIDSPERLARYLAREDVQARVE